jgi:hypothetical protein
VVYSTKVKGYSLIMDNSNLERLYRILLFSCERKLKNLASEALLLLEARCQYIKQLESTLTKMGIEGYENSGIDFQRDRKRILDNLGREVRELKEIDKML